MSGADVWFSGQDSPRCPLCSGTGLAGDGCRCCGGSACPACGGTGEAS